MRYDIKLQVSAQQKNQSTKWKDNLWNGKKYLQTIYLIVKWVKVAQSCPTLCDPMDYVVHGILQARILEWVAFPFSRGSSQPRSSAMQVDSLPAEPQGKPKNTGVDSLSLLWWIFPTQELNRGVLHCRWSLYQLSYQGIPDSLALPNFVADKRTETQIAYWYDKGHLAPRNNV